MHGRDGTGYAAANEAEPVGERYRRVNSEDLNEFGKQFYERIGPANPRPVVRALRLSSGFAA